MQPTVLALGHSHLVALADAYRAPGVAAGLPFRLVTLQLQRPAGPAVVPIDGRPEYDPAIVPAVLDALRATSPSLVVLMLEGSQAVVTGVARPLRPWDFMLPAESASPAEGSDRDLLPFDLVTDIARRRFAHTGRFLDKVRDEMGPRVVALSPPPPCGDDAALLERIDRNRALRDAVLATGLSPRAWRQRIWIMMVTALAETYMTRGITFLPPPPAAMDAQGFLPLPLLSDALHGTPGYGKMLLRQLVEWSPRE